MASKFNGISSRGYGLTTRQINLFPKGTRFIGETGHFSPEFRPLAMRGKGGEFSSYRYDPNTKKKLTNKPWVTKKGNTVDALTMAEFKAHLRIAAYGVEKSASNFAVVLSMRAQRIFQESFKRKKFYSADGSTWPALSPKTIKNRMRNGTWPGAGGMLREFGDLYSSIKQRKVGENSAQVFTDPSEFKPHVYKNGRTRRSICYAGIHNNGGELGLSYGNGFGGKKPFMPVRQRQFMGHSTYLFKFAKTIMRTYLFDDVFVSPKKKR